MNYAFDPIGVVCGGGIYPQEAPHQSTFAANEGYIELAAGKNFEQALEDLNGFDRIWVVFVFDRNSSWKPKVRPPVGGMDKRVGVFATRSPHRPNRIGMSCVELDKIEGNKIFIRNFDLLDRTPIIDIKPYIPAADAFPASCTGWLDEAEKSRFSVQFTPEVEAACTALRTAGGPDLLNFCRVQLSYSPLDSSRKRLTQLAENRWQISNRGYSVSFEIDPETKIIRVYALNNSVG
jgi:tRNA-Thr(GGU) m(6)t(6)A37 methyltransferase TsaA